ncbi:uncharacterized protein LOC105763379 [Gossypium raimondii]|uniref:uncharacterized protein LOC105763379 n=1 Tax=Gossypium raimondii TaxID=29730 RepID=UPI00063A88A0|nr:uncharacterized protein LOC105763379 [Gossypium raimondii]
MDAFVSRQFKTPKGNYPTHDLELVAVVFTLKMWRHSFYDERWVELLKDYECSIEYHPSKANGAVDGLSHRVITDLRAMLARLSLVENGGLLAELGRICVPNDKELRQSILQEVHSSPYAMHPGGNKMYRDLQEFFLWPRQKREVVAFVSHFLTCQKVKAEHQLLSGLLQQFKIPQWKGKRVTIGFVKGLPLTPTKKESVWVIIEWLRKSLHFIPIRTNYSLQKLAKLYIVEIVRLHRILVSIISERDS